MTVYLIRHGKTAGNLTGRYIGTTDEPLCSQGAAELQTRAYPAVQRVFVSPMKRCRETASLLYPDVKQTVVPDLRECNFGLFEGKNYAELNGRADYQAWIDSGGELPFPEGESRKTFAARCVAAFRQAMGTVTEEDAAFVAHGGTIMAIMEACAKPPQNYFCWQVKCGEGFALEADGRWRKL